MAKPKSQTAKNSRNLNLTHAQLRRDYRSAGLLEKQVAAQPMRQFAKWFDEAVRKKVTDANAFVLATADAQGRPAARVLLMKGYHSRGITFFTNYGSAKGRQITSNPRGEAVFFWNRLNRQVRLTGRLVRLPRKAALEYFRSRPWEAQIAACASSQSRPVGDRAELETRFRLLKEKWKGSFPAMPAEWGGYELRVTRVEFWQGRPNRLHDRICYEPASRGRWNQVRLQP